MLILIKRVVSTQMKILVFFYVLTKDRVSRCNGVYGVTTAIILHRRVQNEERIILELTELKTRSYENKGLVSI